MLSLLGVDLGTTGCKAALYAANGKLLAYDSIEYPLISPQPEYVEQDAALWWSLTLQTMASVIRQAGDLAATVRGISVSSQGISFVPVSPSGEILRHAICWLDTRASTEAARISARVGDDRLFTITGKRPSAAYMLPKLLWLQQHERDLYAATGTFLMAHDYLVYRLCGARRTDYSLAGGSMLLDLSGLCWSQELLNSFQIHRDQLPELAWGGTVAGTLSRDVADLLGLQPGIAVVVGGQDQKCAALAAGIRPRVATVSLGTAAAISAVTDKPILDPAKRIPAFPFVRPGQWVLEGVVGTAGAALRWARDTLFPQENYAALDRLAAASPPGANGVRFYPHLAGATSPNWQDRARGAFTGLTLATERGDIVRSILEGVAFEIRSNLDVIETLAAQERGSGIKELVLFGGGARSETWKTIIAQITGRPVIGTETVEMANWGACILAGIGTGVYEDHLTSWPVAALSPTEPGIDAVSQYKELYQAYVLGASRLDTAVST